MAKNVKAKVVAKTTVNNEPAEIGSIVEVCENTFRNLEKKGRLVAATEAEIEASEKADEAKGAKAAKGKGKGKGAEETE